MTREELVQLLKDYKENKAKRTIKLKELKNTRIQLKNCEESDTNMTAPLGINQDIHSKNKIGNKVLDRVEKNDSKKRDLEEKISTLEDEVKSLTDKVNEVEDRLSALKYKEKEILVAYYIDGRTAEDIGNNLYYKLFSQTRTARRIQMIIDEATEKMLNL